MDNRLISGATAPPTTKAANFAHTNEPGHPTGATTKAGFKASLAYYDVQIERVLSDMEATRQRFAPNSPTAQRLTSCLSREYVRLYEKRQALQICLDAQSAGRPTDAFTRSFGYRVGGVA